jgi:type I restriction enzyme, S subunit
MMRWRTIQLGDLLTHRKDRYKPNDPVIQNLRRVEKINFSGQIIISEKESNTDMILIKKGDLILSGINVAKGAIAVYEGDEDVLATIHYSAYTYDQEKVNLDFLKLFLKSPVFTKLLKEQVPGGIKTEIKSKHLLPLKARFPKNVNDQEQIARQYYQKESTYLQLHLNLSNQLTLLDQLNQAILQEAVQGKLVPQEAGDEPAADLLKRIKAEKARSGKKEKPLPPIKPGEIPFEVPYNWVWCKINDLVFDYKNDIRTGPFGTALNKSEYKDQGIPVWGIESISKDGRFTYNNKIFVSEVKAVELKSFGVKGGDLIISRSGTIGELCMLPYDVTYGLLSTNLMKISVNKDIIMPEYFCHIIKGSNHIKMQLTELCSGSTRLFITQTILSELIFPLPPLSEQRRIVSEIERQMAITRQLKESILSAQQSAEQLMKSIIQEAFQAGEEGEA